MKLCDLKEIKEAINNPKVKLLIEKFKADDVLTLEEYLELERLRFIKNICVNEVTSYVLTDTGKWLTSIKSL